MFSLKQQCATDIIPTAWMDALQEYFTALHPTWHLYAAFEYNYVCVMYPVSFMQYFLSIKYTSAAQFMSSAPPPLGSIKKKHIIPCTPTKSAIVSKQLTAAWSRGPHQYQRGSVLLSHSGPFPPAKTRAAKSLLALNVPGEGTC